LTSLVNDLEERRAKYLFVIFEWSKRMVQPPDWRVRFIIDFLGRREIDFLLARNAVLGHAGTQVFDWNKYATKDGHPNELYNRLVSTRILGWLNDKRASARA